MIEAVSKIIQPIYMVGGAVRDELLGKTPKDYDFTTPLNPYEIERLVREAGRRPYLVGQAFGTVGFKVEYEGKFQMVEVTTFRTEKYKTGSRKPEVEFTTNITEDLSRRDFTINAIAKSHKYVDPFGGIGDTENKIIRAVGKPKERFKEDPLRMLRAARFAAQLEFTIEELTEAQAKKMAPSILDVSRERWVLELDKLLTSEKPSIGLDFLARTRLINFLIPELSLQVGYNQNSRYHKLSLWEHTLTVVDNVPNNVEIRWAALLHDIAKPFVRTDRPDRSNYIDHEKLGKELTQRIGLHLRWSNDRLHVVTGLVGTHLEETNPLREADNNAK